MSFHLPFFLLLIPIMALWFLWNFFSFFKKPLSTLNLSVLPPSPGFSALIFFMPDLFFFLGMIFLAFVLASPQKQTLESSLLTGRKIALVIDRSGSMLYEVPSMDGYVSRFDLVKRATKKFITEHPRDSIGLFSFARFPQNHSPFTRSHSVLFSLVDLLKTAQSRAEDGTGIGDALVLALAHLQKARKNKNISEDERIILLTDGYNNAGERSPLEAAQIALEYQIPIYTLGIAGEGSIEVEGVFGKERVFDQGGIDVDSLERIAQLTGGKFFVANTFPEILNLYEGVQKILEEENTPYSFPNYMVFLLIALLFFLLGALSEIFLQRIR